MIVSIHQPNFFPWLGYFAKIALSDVFVFLDGVEFTRGSYINRVKLLCSGLPMWRTCPVKRGSGSMLLSHVLISEDSSWKRKMLSGLCEQYGRTAHFDEVHATVQRMIMNCSGKLADVNVSCILSLSARLGLSTRFARQSEIADESFESLRGSQLLSHICRKVGADRYLAGRGSDGYEDVMAYTAKGISFEKQPEMQWSYPQPTGEDFIPGLSILDTLYCVGWQETARLIREGLV